MLQQQQLQNEMQNLLLEFLSSEDQGPTALTAYAHDLIPIIIDMGELSGISHSIEHAYRIAMITLQTSVALVTSETAFSNKSNLC